MGLLTESLVIYSLPNVQSKGTCVHHNSTGSTLFSFHFKPYEQCTNTCQEPEYEIGDNSAPSSPGQLHSPREDCKDSWHSCSVTILAQYFILFPFLGVKNDTNQAAFLPPPKWSSRLDLEQLLGGTCCWASPSQGWSPEE